MYHNMFTFGTCLAIKDWFSWSLVIWNIRAIWTFLAVFGHISKIIRIKTTWKYYSTILWIFAEQSVEEERKWQHTVNIYCMRFLFFKLLVTFNLKDYYQKECSLYYIKSGGTNFQFSLVQLWFHRSLEPTRTLYRICLPIKWRIVSLHKCDSWWWSTDEFKFCYFTACLSQVIKCSHIT